MVRNPAHRWPSARARTKPATEAGPFALSEVQVQWGLGILALYAVTFILPSLYAGYLRPAYLIAAALWSVLAYPKVGRVPIAFPLVALLALQTWSIVTAIHATYALGRGLGLGRADFYLAEHAVPFFVTAALVMDRPRLRVQVRSQAVPRGGPPGDARPGRPDAARQADGGPHAGQAACGVRAVQRMKARIKISFTRGSRAWTGLSLGR